MVVKIDKRLATQLAVLALLILVTIIDIKFRVPAWKFFIDGLCIGMTIDSIFMLRILNMGNEIIDGQHRLIEKIMSEVIDPVNDIIKSKSNSDLDTLKDIIRKAQEEQPKSKTGKKK